MFCVKNILRHGARRQFMQNISTSCVVQSVPKEDVMLTSVRYPTVKRKQFAEVQAADLNYFTDVLGHDAVITDEDTLKFQNTDWLRTCRGMSTVMLYPKETDHVSKILSYCNSRQLAVCPQGGNTGLVGGSIPVFDEIIISTSRMNKIISIDPLSGVLVCEAGCILENLDNYAGEHNFVMPLDLGAKGSCQIGGNIATNAGGLRVVRYGSLNNTVLGMEMVLANGNIVDCLSELKKDNTGYDLKRLMIGSEGSLGMITKVAIQCPVRPKAISLAFLGCDSFDKVLQVLSRAKAELGETLSAVEFMDNAAMQSVVKYLKYVNPIKECNFYALVETSGANVEHDADKLDKFLSLIMDKEIVCDGTVASNKSQIQTLWQIREQIAESHLHEGYTYKYDVSVPTSQLYKPVEVMRERMKHAVLRCCGYGHLGDGNLHLNLITPSFTNEVLDQIEPYLFEMMQEMKGSISAEHGLGFKKANYIHYSKSKEAVDLMKQIKSLFDPNGILNPYKVLPR